MTTLPSCAEAGEDSAVSSKKKPTTEVLPPAEFRPLISNSVWPGPEVRIAMPGTVCARLLKSVSPLLAISAAEIAVTLMGVSCTVDSRLVAVITISGSSEFKSPSAQALPATASAIEAARMFLCFTCSSPQNKHVVRQQHL